MISRPEFAPDLLRDCSTHDRDDWVQAMARIDARVAPSRLCCVSLDRPDFAECIAARRGEGRQVLALASPARTAQRKAAFAAGVDEFLITGPIDPAQLAGRLAFLARGAALPPDLALDPERRTATLAGVSHPLVAREARLLATLVAARGGVVSHAELLDKAWDGRSEDRHNLRVAVNRLRAKLEPEPDLPRYILTEPVVGYRIGNGGHCTAP